MITAIMLGAGQRGYEVYGAYSKNHGDKLKFVAVAEPNKERRERFAKIHNIAQENCFEEWSKLLECKKMADSAFVCTQDRMHVEPTMAALEKGYHVVLEKPMASTPQECVMLGNCAEEYKRVLIVCHVLRYSEFFSSIKSIITAGDVGEIVTIKHAENVSYWHQAHSFVRGNWNNSDKTTPMVLQKTCHDMDILLWLIEKPCVKISSFGSLYEFKKEKMPKGAPPRCTDGCPHENTCIYNAKKFYLGEETGWPVSTISEGTSLDERKKALETGPYGRCVYQCNNNVVDHQIINLEFENGVTANVTMAAFTPECTRFIEIMGTKGYLRAEMNKFGENSSTNEIEVSNFLTGKKTVHSVEDTGLMSGHEDADALMIENFVQQIENGDLDGLTSAKRSVESHLMSLAAERSRLESRVVEMAEMWENK